MVSTFAQPQTTLEVCTITCSPMGVHFIRVTQSGSFRIKGSTHDFENAFVLVGICEVERWCFQVIIDDLGEVLKPWVHRCGRSHEQEPMIGLLNFRRNSFRPGVEIAWKNQQHRNDGRKPHFPEVTSSITRLSASSRGRQRHVLLLIGRQYIMPLSWIDVTFPWLRQYTLAQKPHRRSVAISIK